MVAHGGGPRRASAGTASSCTSATISAAGCGRPACSQARTVLLRNARCGASGQPMSNTMPYTVSVPPPRRAVPDRFQRCSPLRRARIWCRSRRHRRRARARRPAHGHPGISRSFRLARRGNRVQVQAAGVVDHVAQRSRIAPERRDDLDAFGQAGLDALPLRPAPACILRRWAPARWGRECPRDRRTACVGTS